MAGERSTANFGSDATRNQHLSEQAYIDAARVSHQVLYTYSEETKAFERVPILELGGKKERWERSPR